MPQIIEQNCFGNYNGSDTCKRCDVFKDCRYIIADGAIDAIAAAFELMVQQLPEGLYEDTDKLSKQVSYVTWQVQPKPLTTVKEDLNNPHRTPDFEGTESMGDEAWDSVLNKIRKQSSNK